MGKNDTDLIIDRIQFDDDNDEDDNEVNPIPVDFDNELGIKVERTPRGSVSHENNVLLEPEVLNDDSIQALVLTVLVGDLNHRFCINKFISGNVVT